MSRIGKKPIAVPKGVKIDVLAGAVDVQGPKGTLRQPLPPGIGFELQGEELHARTLREDPATEGFRKDLDIVGVGYRAELKGKQVVFALGYSHPVVFDVPNGIDIVIEKQTHITVTGIDRQAVGQVAANIRRLRKPDPYKQKGVRYTGEVLKKKAGKTGAK
jgi:large subunit ribosomal protein L6